MATETHQSVGDETPDTTARSEQWWGDASTRSVVGAALLGLASALLGGLAAGLLWAATAPAAKATVTADGLVRTEEQLGQVFPAEGVFAVLMAVAGLLTAVLGRRWVRNAGPLAVAGLVIAGVAGSVVAWRVGVWAGPDEVLTLTGRTVGDLVDMPLVLRSAGLLLAWPIITVFVTMWVAVVAMLMAPPASQPEPSESAEAPGQA